MALFSQRIGLNPLEKAIQRESMDADLRNDLWNALYLSVLRKHGRTRFDTLTSGGEMVHKLCIALWLHYFKQPIDQMPDFHDGRQRDMSERIRSYFFKSEWHKVFDLLEFIAKSLDSACADELIARCNTALERERSAYRFVSKELTEITSATEIDAIEHAIGEKAGPVQAHLKRALELLADRKQPDFRNSVKESISAVESECRRMSGDDNATLGQALTQIEKSHRLHTAFKKALSALYGYTSDESGIRHALLEEDNVVYADAQYMLVSCSAFINYLRLLDQKR